MRFSLRTLLIVFFLCVWFTVTYVKWKSEQQLFADLGDTDYYDFIYPRAFAADDKLYERFSSERLSALASQYAKAAQSKPSHSRYARIAAAALSHLGSIGQQAFGVTACRHVAIVSKTVERGFEIDGSLKCKRTAAR